jgi:hypothetical protein
MKDLDKILEKIYNRIGNSYLTNNFDTGPFEFKVNIRKGDGDEDLQDYIVEVYSVPDLPESFKYKGNNKEGIHISVLKKKFREYIGYVDPTFGEFRKTIGIKFMNLK